MIEHWIRNRGRVLGSCPNSKRQVFGQVSSLMSGLELGNMDGSCVRYWILFWKLDPSFGIGPQVGYSGSGLKVKCWINCWEAKEFRWNRTMTEYVECKLIEVTYEVGLEMRLDTQNVQEGYNQVSWVYSSGGWGHQWWYHTLYWCSMNELESCLRGLVL